MKKKAENLLKEIMAEHGTKQPTNAVLQELQKRHGEVQFSRNSIRVARNHYVKAPQGGLVVRVGSRDAVRFALPEKAALYIAEAVQRRERYQVELESEQPEAVKRIVVEALEDCASNRINTNVLECLAGRLEDTAVCWGEKNSRGQIRSVWVMRPGLHPGKQFPCLESASYWIAERVAHLTQQDFATK